MVESPSMVKPRLLVAPTPRCAEAVGRGGGADLVPRHGVPAVATDRAFGPERPGGPSRAWRLPRCTSTPRRRRRRLPRRPPPRTRASPPTASSPGASGGVSSRGRPSAFAGDRRQPHLRVHKGNSGAWRHGRDSRDSSPSPPATNLAYVAVAHPPTAYASSTRVRLRSTVYRRCSRRCSYRTPRWTVAGVSPRDGNPRPACGESPCRPGWASWTELGVVQRLSAPRRPRTPAASSRPATLVAVESRAESVPAALNTTPPAVGFRDVPHGGGGDGGSTCDDHSGRRWSPARVAGGAPRRSPRGRHPRAASASLSAPPAAVPGRLNARGSQRGLRATDMNGKWATSEGPTRRRGSRARAAGRNTGDTRRLRRATGNRVRTDEYPAAARWPKTRPRLTP